MNSHETTVALWTFLKMRMPAMSLDAALQAVRESAPLASDTPKSLAPRLKAALAKAGVRLKHTHALDAAARLLGAASLHATEVAPDYEVFTDNQRVGKEVGSFSEAAEMIVMAALNWQRKNNSRLFKFSASMNRATVLAFGVSFDDGMVAHLPVARLRARYEDRTRWQHELRQLCERLRRRIEETRLAVLDGTAVVEICEDVEDVEFAELVVNFTSAYAEETARGDELTCWKELEHLAAFDKTEVRFVDGTWLADAPVQWLVSVLRPSGPTPSAKTRPLDAEATERLFRRYQLARQIMAGPLRRYELSKVSGAYFGAPSTYLVDIERLKERLQWTKRSWQWALDTAQEGLEAGRPISDQAFSRLCAALELEDPNWLLDWLGIDALARLSDGSFLRPLMPRIDEVIAHLPAISSGDVSERAARVVDEFEGKVRWLQHAGDVVRTPGTEYDPGFYLEYANAGQDLVDDLAKLGLVAYAGICPHFKKVEGKDEQERFGVTHTVQQALLLRVVHAEDAR